MGVAIRVPCFKYWIKPLNSMYFMLQGVPTPLLCASRSSVYTTGGAYTITFNKEMMMFVFN